MTIIPRHLLLAAALYFVPAIALPQTPPPPRLPGFPATQPPPGAQSPAPSGTIADMECCCATFIKNPQLHCAWNRRTELDPVECNLTEQKDPAERMRLVLPSTDLRCALVMPSGSADLTAIWNDHCKGKNQHDCERTAIPAWTEVRESATWTGAGQPQLVNGKRCCGDCCEAEAPEAQATRP